MSDEELERRMAFIVEQQARFAFDIQQLREAQTQTDQVVAQTGQIVARLANVALEGFRDVNAKINVLVDSQIRTDALEVSLRSLIATLATAVMWNEYVLQSSSHLPECNPTSACSGPESACFSLTTCL